MIDFIATQDYWIVVPFLKTYFWVEQGQQFTTNHKCWLYSDEESAISHALSIGWQPELEEVFE